MYLLSHPFDTKYHQHHSSCIYYIIIYILYHGVWIFGIYVIQLECMCVCVLFLAVYNKAQALRIWNHQFKLWMVI